MTYRLIAHQELTGNQATITFSSISQSFTDLVLVTSLRTNNTSRTDGWEDVLLIQNGSSSNVSVRQLYGTGAGGGQSNSGLGGGVFTNHANMTANTFSSVSFYFTNYTSNTNKAFTVESTNEQNAASALTLLGAGLITTSSPLTSLGFSTIGGVSFVAGSSATLFGITSGSFSGVVVS